MRSQAAMATADHAAVPAAVLTGTQSGRALVALAARAPLEQPRLSVRGQSRPWQSCSARRLPSPYKPPARAGGLRVIARSRPPCRSGLAQPPGVPSLALRACMKRCPVARAPGFDKVGPRRREHDSCRTPLHPWPLSTWSTGGFEDRRRSPGNAAGFHAAQRTSGRDGTGNPGPPMHRRRESRQSRRQYASASSA